jgi:hypothetical protein
MDGIFSGDGTVRALGTVKLNGTVLVVFDLDV